MSNKIKNEDSLLLGNDNSPVCFLINEKSGGRLGQHLIHSFSNFSNCLVFDLSVFWEVMEGGGRESSSVQKFNEFLMDKKARIVVGGGDGSVSFVCALIEFLNRGNVQGSNEYEDQEKYLEDLRNTKDQRPLNPIAILPIGVGNELSRCIGWSSTFHSSTVWNCWSGSSEHSFLNDVRRGKIIDLDLWNVQIEVPQHLHETVVALEGENLRVEEKLGKFALLCFFSLGFDARIAHNFHQFRENHPSLTSTVALNKTWYTWFGIKELFTPREGISSFLEVHVDGHLVVLPSNIKTIQVLNIHSSADGVDFFGTGEPSNDSELKEYLFPTLNDGLLEVVGTEGVKHLMMIRTHFSHSRRIAQGNHIKITVKKPIPAQLDGEAWIQMPCIIHITHQRKVPVVKGFGSTHNIAPPVKKRDSPTPQELESQPLIAQRRGRSNSSIL